mgnify:CR=1 FL=1
MSGVSAFDIVVCVVLLGGMASGFTRGAIRQAADLVALYVGLAVSAQYTPLVASALGPKITFWPAYIVTAVVFYAILGTISGILSLVAQTLLHSNTTRRRELTDLSQIAGFGLGALGAAALIGVSIPVIRYVTSASWASWDDVREIAVRSLDSSYLRPFFDRMGAWVLWLIQPLLPAGLPDVLRGRLLRALLLGPFG